MFNLAYPKWLNLILFQAIWFAAILGQGALEWLVALLLVTHVVLCADLKNELLVVIVCAALGITVDSVLTLSGVFLFDPMPSILPIPFWLIGVWIGFAATLRHSMSYLMAKPWIAIPAATIAAPCSYLAGKGLGAVDFGLDIITTALVVGLLWLCLMTIFVCIYRTAPRNPSCANRSLSASLSA